MKTAMLVMASAVMALVPVATRAQDQDKPITLKIGAQFPTRSELKDALGDTWFSAGAEYAFALPQKAGALPNPTSPIVFLDYTGNDKTVNGFKNEGRAVTLGVGAKYTFPATGRPGARPYLGAGVGVAFVHGRSSHDVPGGTPPPPPPSVVPHATTTTVTDDRDLVNGAVKVFGGVEIEKTVVLEVSYWNAGKVVGYNLEGIDASIGVKF